MSTSVILWKTSTTLYNAVSIRLEIESIWRAIGNIYSDISNAHINSALQAMDAAEHSKLHEHEILDAISHLRDAYNICESVLHKKREKLIFPDKYLIPKEERNRYLLYIAHLAGIISILYKSLNECRTAEEWKNKAIEKFELGFDISAMELYIIDMRFAEEKTSVPSFFDFLFPLFIDDHDFNVTYKITPEGEKYVQAQKLLQAKEFGESIEQRKLELKQLKREFSSF